jgi:hypothetical protein
VNERARLQIERALFAQLAARVVRGDVEAQM